MQDRLKISELETRFATLWDAAGGPELQREYRFAPPRRWRADFAWPQARLLVEIEGGLRKRGRHLTPRGFAPMQRSIRRPCSSRLKPSSKCLPMPETESEYPESLWREAWTPPDRQDVWKWAEEHIESIPYSPIPGRFRISNSPMLREAWPVRRRRVVNLLCSTFEKALFFFPGLSGLTAPDIQECLSAAIDKVLHDLHDGKDDSLTP